MAAIAYNSGELSHKTNFRPIIHSAPKYLNQYMKINKNEN